MSAEDKKSGDLSAPSLDELDSSWGGEEEEEFDEDATTVQRIPKELVALSRRGTELEEAAAKKGGEAPEKHEAITARPPPANAEPSMVIDAPHEQLPSAPDLSSPVEMDEDELEESSDESDEDDEPNVDDIDNNWGEVEEKAAAADIAAGLDPEARRAAAEKRAAQRKEKARAKTLAARDKRKAHVEAQRQKAKKPKRRSTPPPKDPDPVTERRPKSGAPAAALSTRPASMSPLTSPPAGVPGKNDLLRMVLLVALVVLVGALVIGLARR